MRQSSILLAVMRLSKAMPQAQKGAQDLVARMKYATPFDHSHALIGLVACFPCMK